MSEFQKSKQPGKQGRRTLDEHLSWKGWAGVGVILGVLYFLSSFLWSIYTYKTPMSATGPAKWSSQSYADHYVSKSSMTTKRASAVKHDSGVKTTDAQAFAHNLHGANSDLKSDNYLRAKQEIEQALAIRPNNPQALFCLAAICEVSLMHDIKYKGRPDLSTVRLCKTTTHQLLVASTHNTYDAGTTSQLKEALSDLERCEQKEY